LIAPGYPVFLFGATGKNWRIRAGVSDRDVVKIKPGDSVSVTMDAYPGQNFPGTVNQLGEMANPSTGTYEVEILLNPVKKRLVSGFVASVRIFLSDEDPLVMIPIESLVDAEGKTGYVYAITGNNTVEKSRVEIVSLTDSGAIIRPLPEDIRQIVTEGATYLINGDTVNVIR